MTDWGGSMVDAEAAALDGIAGSGKADSESSPDEVSRVMCFVAGKDDRSV